MNVHHHSEHLISFQILFLLGRPLSPWVKKIIQGLYLNQTARGPGPTFEMVKSEILDPGNVECYERGPHWVCLSYVQLCKILGSQFQTFPSSFPNFVLERGALIQARS